MKPVALPPGPARLSTKLALTGSATAANTIGKVWLICCNAVTARVPLAKMTSGVSASNSAAYFALRSALSSLQRVSIRTLRPTFQLNSCSPWWNAASRSWPSGLSAARFMSTPIRRGRSSCCARAASGQAATPPPSSVMNSRRFMSGMGTFSPMRYQPADRPVRSVFRTSNLGQRGRQVLGADLKCSESRRRAALNVSLTRTRIAHGERLDGHVERAAEPRPPLDEFHVRPARSIFSNALNFCCSAIAALVRSNPSVSLVSLSWLKAFGTEHRSGNRSTEELDKRFRRLWHFGGCANPSGPDCRAGEFPGKRAKHFRSRYRHDLRSLCDPDLGFALGNDLSSLGPRHQNSLRL